MAPALLTKRILEFCGFLRNRGFAIGLQDELAALQAALVAGITDRDSLAFALRATLCSSKEDSDIFLSLFDQFWKTRAQEAEMRSSQQPVSKAELPAGSLFRTSSVSSESALEGKQTTGASAIERLRRTDFSDISAADQEILERIAFRLWKQMSIRLIRRWRSRERSERIDLRRTIRQSIGTGGEPIDLRFKSRKFKRLNLVTLLDVSGSMELYSMFLVRFLHALHRYFKRVDSFLFSTKLTCFSNALRKNDVAAVVESISQNVTDWAGGTRIGDCLHEFNERYARKLLTRNTIVIILSDGWDTGSPEALVKEVQKIKRRARKLIWLNPLLGVDGYQPVTQAMAAVLPFADAFAPAHNIQSLINLEKIIGPHR